ncbi:hypothetical protein HPP92_005101 [Vanilla planifolia]|nr:hypothetical protein HPP92_005101 [Vanilla planifolia]
MKVASKATEEEILSYCRHSMPRFMAPKKVVFMKDLPKTATGKIQKTKLREMARKFNITDENQTPPSPVEATETVRKRLTTPSGNRKKTVYYDQSSEQVLALSRL